MPRGVPKSGKRKSRGAAKQTAAAETVKGRRSKKTEAGSLQPTVAAQATRRDGELSTQDKFSMLVQSILILADIGTSKYESSEVQTALRNELLEQVRQLSTLRRDIFGGADLYGSSDEDEEQPAVATVPSQAPLTQHPIAPVPMPSPVPAFGGSTPQNAGGTVHQ